MPIEILKFILSSSVLCNNFGNYMRKLQYFCGKQQFRLQLLDSDIPTVYAEKVPSDLVKKKKKKSNMCKNLTNILKMITIVKKLRKKLRLRTRLERSMQVKLRWKWRKTQVMIPIIYFMCVS